MRYRLPYALVSRVLAILLLAAAGLKAYGLALDPINPSGIFSARWFQVGVTEFEIALAVWLFWGRQPGLSWLVSVAVFSVFSVVNIRLGWIGQASCGCFGRVAVNPWAALGIDVTVLAALLVSRPPDPLSWVRGNSTRVRLVRGGLGVACGVGLFVGVLAGLAAVQYGSVEAAVAGLRGDRVSVQPMQLYMGDGEPGEVKEAAVQLINWTDHEIRVIGGTSDCSCITTRDMPVAIGPGERRSIRVEVRLPQSSGAFNRVAMFQLDDEGYREVRVRLLARVTEPNGADAQKKQP